MNGHGVGGETNHIAFFEDIPGRVDLWPIVEPETAEPTPEDWENPQDLKTPEHHVNRLASMVARNVKTMIETGSIPRKGSETTQVEPGDILILVRNRSGLFYPMLRALKKLSLPVAGADQLILNDELAVKDITSLLAFLSMPDDDLALAEVLKSPLFGWSEQALFSLAHARTAVTLWREMFIRQAEWPETFEILNELRKESDFLRPYDLIQRILVRHKGRSKFLARLGDEAEDGLDALLHQALQYEATETPSLTGFIGWLGAEEIKIKRVLDESSNLIRVMTVHGSKGLEAPIVILPDTLREVSSPKDEMIDLGQGRVVWKSAKESNGGILEDAITKLKDKNDEEERRLLYVAMTRAENWLIVAGAGKKKKDGTCWYTLVEDGMQAAQSDEFVFEAGPGKRYEHGNWPERRAVTRTISEADNNLPNWAVRPPSEPEMKKPVLSPSDLGGAKALPSENAGRTEEEAMRRGRHLHLLLEHLPTYDKDKWRDIAGALLSRGDEPALTHEVDELLEEAERVLSGLYEWDVFGEKSLAEVPFSGALPSLNGGMVHGIMDRLIVQDEVVQIVDFKSNMTVPETAAEIPEGVLRQLGAYAEICGIIYPNKVVQTAVLWTKTATLMPVEHDIVIAALGRARVP
jgi:ATP-dependent helicase/nuclease subunit A